MGKKIEIIEKNLKDKIPIKVLSVQYDVPISSVSNWISLYKQYGEKGLLDRRYKEKNNFL